MSLVDVISIDKDISLAKTMPSSFYLDEKYFQKSLNNIFKHSWQFLSHKKLIDSAVTPFNFLEDSINEPLIISKNKNDLKCFSNVCTHRGNVLCTKKSNSIIKCSYHGRTFDLKGKMKNMPGFEGVKNFPKQSDNLKEMKIIDWNKFIFCSLMENFSIDEILSDISKRLKNFPFQKLNFDKKKSKTYTLNTHWALYCENYLEGFHVPFVHKGLNTDINLESYKTKILTNGVLQYTNSRNNDIYAYYYWLFPNMMFNFYDWGLSINIIEPINKEKTRIKFLSFPIKDKTQPTNTNSSLDRVEKEDQKIVQSVQKGIKSTFYDRGRYSMKYEKGVHHFHRLLAKYLK